LYLIVKGVQNNALASLYDQRYLI